MGRTGAAPTAPGAPGGKGEMPRRDGRLLPATPVLWIGGILMAALTAGQAPAKEAAGPLRVHPENPRYFTADGKKAVFLTGSHTWNNLADMGRSDPPEAFDFDAYLDFM